MQTVFDIFEGELDEPMAMDADSLAVADEQSSAHEDNQVLPLWSDNSTGLTMSEDGMSWIPPALYLEEQDPRQPPPPPPPTTRPRSFEARSRRPQRGRSRSDVSANAPPSSALSENMMRVRAERRRRRALHERLQLAVQRRSAERRAQREMDTLTEGFSQLQTRREEVDVLTDGVARLSTTREEVDGLTEGLGQVHATRDESGDWSWQAETVRVPEPASDDTPRPWIVSDWSGQHR